MKTERGMARLVRCLALATALCGMTPWAGADPKESPNGSKRPLVLPDLKGGDVDGSGIAGGAMMDGDGLGNGPGVGDAAPGFSLAAARGGSIGLRDLVGRWGLIVFVADRAQLGTLEPVATTMRSLGGTLYSISRDGSGWLTDLAAREQLTFELLSDPTGQVSELFGMYDDAGDAIRPGAALLNPRGRIAGLLGSRATSPDALEAFARGSVNGP